MKTLAAILLWGILLFNWVGYRVLNDYFQGETKRQFEAKIDQHLYDESELQCIKVPVTHLSYYNNSIAFERVNGQIEINGIPYQYVKRRIYNDTLELLCIPNHTALQLRLSRDEYFKIVADIQHPQGKQHGQHPSSLKSFSGDPYTLADPFRLKGLSFIEMTRADYSFVFYHSIPGCTDLRPPAGLV